MTELHWQAAFLLVAAFFLGGVIACSLKRKLYRRGSAHSAVTQASVAPSATEPKIEVAPRLQAGSDLERFGSALAGASSSPLPSALPSSGVPEPPIAAPALETVSAPVPQPAKAGVPSPEKDGEPLVRDMSALRSVRSEALRHQEAPNQSVAGNDLKRIRGIGVLIEKKLNSLGVSSYEQVANWTGADIERVSQILDFKGRIERENWIEQARILATGGQTEFSRRNDRGDA